MSGSHEFHFEKVGLTLGVTGRRHIVPDALESVERTTRLLLRSLAELDVPSITLFTGLAVGADSLIVRLAFEENVRLGRNFYRVVAVLPKAKSEYEHDFKDVAVSGERSQLDDFRALLAQCDETFCLADGNVSDDVLACYARLGDFLAEYSDVLVAFWSGDSSVVKRGGTVDVVLQTAKRCESDPKRFVFSIETPELLRKKNPDGTKTYLPEPTGKAGLVALLRAVPHEPVVFDLPERGVAEATMLLRQNLLKSDN